MTAMDDHEFLAGRFDAHRDRLRAVALRLLGSHGEAEEALYEARARLGEVDRWLAVAVGRVCVGRLTQRGTRAYGRGGAVPRPERPETQAPAQDGVDSVWLALLVVLDSLAADERLAFALHDLFGLPLAEVARITGRTAEEAGLLARRARLRVRGSDGQEPDPVPPPRRTVVEVFLAAARARDARALAAVLDPDVVAYSGKGAVHGAPAVAEGAAAFAALAPVARPALVDGAPGVAAFREGRVVAAVAFTIRGERITVLDLTTDEERLRGLDLVFPEC
ncbi:sigma factor-like helix-turn-helix DNA-binding protein [Streptomyces sp. NPDC047971]|uniref:sigma factor-like helix-turn-helix DNA-binding protein n=1 Tax=Streptomyces sp. NPDC047971 TaxID=3154499 RepID=UPI0033CDD82B